MKDALAVFRFLASCAHRRERAVLVTLTHVEGSTARAVGTHMAVSEGGASIGSFSGGCVEAAVVAEALEVLAARHARTTRFGAGSRYIDIRLPCGGGIDLNFLPDPSPDGVALACCLLEQRCPILLSLARSTMLVEQAHAGDATGHCEGVFRIRHDPALRLVVMGHGAEPPALLRLAAAYGAETQLLSPNARLVDQARQSGHAAHHLRFLGETSALAADRLSAVVALFHDHDWEEALLLEALRQQPFFIGAMGSSRTHAERCRRLAATDAKADVSRIMGPIGLIPASRDPDTLAVSIMAQVVQAYQREIG